MNKVLLGLALLTVFINCSKPEDYCEELYKNYYYDFERKAAMVETINEKRKVEARGLEWTPNIYKPQTSAL